ncbi:hypothetical protein DMA11_01175 [Marinilabiliaceae bacterium JC017]|nr:hypothetical protein DMA11_01175 [Marinilabiliaceae bacterium JC017]
MPNSKINKFSPVLESLLSSGHRVEVMAAGNSMFPFLRQGDVLLVDPVSLREVQVGQIVVFKDCRKIIAHRLISKNQDSFLCKGDGLFKNDLWMREKSLLGVVIARKRKNSWLKIDSVWRHFFGRMMVVLTPVTGYLFWSVWWLGKKGRLWN